MIPWVLFWLGPGAFLVVDLAASWFYLCVKMLYAVQSLYAEHRARRVL